MKRLTTNVVPFDGPLDAKMCFIGEAPGEHENSALRPFVEEAEAGGLLSRCFRTVGIARNEVLMGNVFSQRPPNNKVNYYFQDSKNTRPTWEGEEHISRLKEYLEERKKEGKVNVLVALGAPALHVLTGKKRILKWRGSVLPCTLVGGFKVYPCCHPSYVNRLMNEPEERLFGEKKKQQQNALPLFLRDLERATEQSSSPDFSPPQREFKIIDNAQEAIIELGKLREGIVAADIETLFSDVGPLHWCIGFSPRPDYAFIIPFLKGRRFFWSLPEERRVLQAISRLFLNPGVKKVFHNCLFDLSVLGRYYGLRCASGSVEDTMLCYHASYPYLKKALETLTSIYTWEPYYKCLLPEVEVLTRLGWIALKNLPEDLEVIQWQEDGELSWTIPKIHQYNIDAPMVRIDSLRHKCSYTFAHTIPWRSTKTKQLKKVSAEKASIGGRFELPVSGNYKEGKENLYWIKFIVAAQADGHIDSHRITFHLIKERKRARLKALCDALDIGWGIRANDVITTYGELVELTIRLLGKPKRFRRWILELNHSTLEELVDEVQYWDGWKYPKAKAVWYSSKYKENVDWVAVAAHLIGKCTHLMPIEDQYGNSAWVVSIKNQDFVGIKPRSHCSDIEYKGNVYCLTTKTGYFMARSENHIFITGNSDGKVWDGRRISDEAEFIYNGRDCCVTREIWPLVKRDAKELGTWEGYRRTMSVIPSLLEMQIRGVRIATEKKAGLQSAFKEKVVEAEATLVESTGQNWNLNSSPQMIRLVYGYLGMPMQYNHKTKKPTTDKDALNRLRKKHPENKVLKAIVDHRKFAKLKNTYAEMKVERDNRIRTSYGFISTYRLNSSESIFGGGGNLQNIPVRTEEGRLVRSLFIPDKGKVLLAGDLRTAEKRVIAWLSNDIRQIEAFLANEDTHWLDAKMIFQIPDSVKYLPEAKWRDNFTNQEHPLKFYRDLTKSIVYAASYGMGFIMLQTILIREEVYLEAGLCKRLLYQYKANNPMLTSWQNATKEEIRATRTLITPSPFKRKRVFRGRLSDNLFRSALAFRPQCTVGEILEVAIQKLHATSSIFEPLLNVHDEVVGQCLPRDIPASIAEVKSALEIPLQINNRELVIPCDFKTGSDWGNLKEIGFSNGSKNESM